MICHTVKTLESPFVSLQKDDKGQPATGGIDAETQWKPLVTVCIGKMERRQQRRRTNEGSNGCTYSSVTSTPAGVGSRVRKQTRSAADANSTVPPSPVERDSSPSSSNKPSAEENALDVSGCVYIWLRREHAAVVPFGLNSP